MSGRYTAGLVLLVLAIAVFGCSQLPTQLVPPEPAGEAVEGEAVALSSVRLFSDSRKTELAYEIEGGRVYQGPVSGGQVILFFNGLRVFRGANTTGEILFTVDGNRVFVGPNTRGPIAYTLERGRVFEGTSKGPIIYTIEGERMYLGANTTGPIVFQATQPLAGSIQFLLPILADQRF